MSTNEHKLLVILVADCLTILTPVQHAQLDGNDVVRARKPSHYINVIIHNLLLNTKEYSIIALVPHTFDKSLCRVRSLMATRLNDP